MKPFRFSLQSIRVLREQRERSAQQRFAETVRAREKAAHLLQQANDELASGWNSLCQELTVGVAAAKLLKGRSWCHVLEQRQKQRQAALLQSQREMDEAWRDLMLARRNRETLDHYHDKCRRAYDREIQRDEQKTLDELGVRRSVTSGGILQTAAARNSAN